MGRGSPRRKSPSHRERSPIARHRNSHRLESPAARDKVRDQVKPAKHDRRSASPAPRSLSPRSKRLRRAQTERGEERSDGVREGERGFDKGRRSGRDDVEGKSSRLRQSRGSRSPQPDKEQAKRLERNNSRGSDRERDKDNDNSMVNERGSGRDNSDHRSRNKRRSHSPQPRPRDEVPNSTGAENRNDEDDSVSRMEAAEEALVKKEKPSFELSGNLAAETNRVRGVTLLFTEPPEACKPVVRWRLYGFKNSEPLDDLLYIHRQSCYLFGRERRVADIPTDHPSCSKQHAVIQYRKVDVEKPDGMMGKEVRPYIMDLGSTNKTFINDAAIEPQRYYELREKDTIKFGNSSREYVLLHENSTS